MTSTKYIDFEGREWTKIGDNVIAGAQSHGYWACRVWMEGNQLVYGQLLDDNPKNFFAVNTYHKSPHLVRAAWDSLMEPEVPQTRTFIDADRVTWRQVGDNLIESEETDDYYAMQMRRRADGKIERRAIDGDWCCADDIFEALIPSTKPEISTAVAPQSAADFLNAALGHMVDRAATYDKPQGERSMGNCVAAFNQLTGHQLTEEQGWLFMAVLKITRTQQGKYRADNYEDLAAYAGLAGEAAAKDHRST